MWSSYSVTDRPPVTGTSSNCNSSIVSSNSREIIEEDVDGTGSSPFFGLVALQLTLLIFISAMGTFANALVFAVFYRRPSLRTISNRFVLSLIMANLMSAVVSVPGHVYQLLIKPEQEQQQQQRQQHQQQQQEQQKQQQEHGDDGVQELADSVNSGGIGAVTWLERLVVDDPGHSWFGSWYWHKQGLDGLTVLVSLASVLSILLISLDRYYAVNSPLHYSIIVTRQKSMAMIGLVWLVAAILSAPVWAGSVLLQHYAPRSQQEPEPSSDTYNGTASQPVLAGQLPTRDQQQEQQYLMNLCYSISLILFGFVWPLAALCWLYLRMYEAALKNSARTRRQSLCSNTNANATEGVVGAAAVAAAATAAATSHVDSSTGTSHHPSLVDALSSAAAAAAVAAENQTCVRLLAAAAAATNSQPRRSNRYWIRLSGMQQQLLALFWREEGRALRTTAMVISSFTCCWLPFFVWLLPFQIHPSLVAEADRQEFRPTGSPGSTTSTGVFLARLAAFSNVLISPAIYVYRNQVAQREAGRVMLLLFCPLRHHRHQRSQSTRYSHDIATPLVMGGLGVGGMTTPQLHHQTGESRLRANSNAVTSSRRSSSLATNNSLADSPTRKGSDLDPMTVTALAQATVVNWRGRSGSIDCRVLTRNNEELGGHHCGPLASPLLAGQAGKRRLSKPRASISGCSYSLDRRPSSSTSTDPANQIEMRQRSQTFSEARLPATSGQRHPSTNTAVSLRSEVIVSTAVIAPSASTTCNDRSRNKKRPSSTTAAAAAAAAAAVAAAELKALNHPLAYPSLDFFDIGLEDYGRRSTSSFSRFIQQQPGPPIPAPAGPLPQVTQQSTNNGRRRRTCSFSKVLSRGTKQPTGAASVAGTGASSSRWPAVFSSGKQQEMAKSTNASSMPSVQQIPSLVTAV